jgi:hypothetical protein
LCGAFRGEIRNAFFIKWKAVCPNSRVLQGFSTKGGVERNVLFAMKGEEEKQTREVKEWLRKIETVR